MPSLLHALFEQQAVRTPHNIAVEDPDTGESITYQALNQASSHLAATLRAKGWGKGDLIGLYLPRSIGLYTAMLAVMKAGAAYLPIDTEIPPERLRFILEDAEAVTTLTSPKHLPTLQSLSMNGYLLETLLTSPSPPTLSDSPSPQPHPNDLCYVIYTSGSTGHPKAVGISHANITTFVHAIEDIYDILPTDRILQGFSTAFDASLEEIWMAFSSGATLVIASHSMMRSFDEFSERLEQLGITVLSTVPTLLSLIQPSPLPKLRLIVVGGEALRADLIPLWQTPQRKLMNSYGPTECSVVATLAWCQKDQPVTIGKALPRYEAILLDTDGQIIHDGKEGELCIGGSAVSSFGYLKRPELNKEKFFDLDGKRFYRTGDLVRRNEHNDLLFCGRIDAQVKLRGYRIELEEIETRLQQALDEHKHLKHACEGVLLSLQHDAEENAHLVAFLLQKTTTLFDTKTLLARLKEVLPSYMLPTYFVSLIPSLVPRMNSGKIERRRLPHFSTLPTLLSLAPPPQQNTQEQSDTPHSAKEKLHAIWQNVLQQTIQEEDSFFDLGGNSVLAAQVISHCRRDPALAPLTIRDLYEHATLQRLLMRLEERLAKQAPPQAPPQEPASTAKNASSHKNEAPAPATAHVQHNQGAAPPHRVSRAQYLAVGTAQILFLVFYFSLGAASLLGTLYIAVKLYPALKAWTAGSWLLLGLGLTFVAPPIFFVGGVLWALFLKRVLVGRFEEGDYPVWSWSYFRWWLKGFLAAPARALAGSFVGTPFAPFFYRLMGAKIGKGVYLGVPLSEMDLITIEEGASIAEHSVLRTHTLERGFLKLRKIHIGKNTFVGTQCVIHGASTGEGVRLHPLTHLHEGMHCPPHTEWRGSPARPVTEATALTHLLERHEREATPRDGWFRWQDNLRIYILQFLYAYALSLLFLMPFFVDLALLLLLDFSFGVVSSVNLWVLLPAAWLFATQRFGCKILAVILGKRLLGGRAKEETISLTSHTYVRRWLTSRLMNYVVAPGGLRGMTETLLMPHFCRWLGMKVGQKAEISDARGWQPDLISLGNGVMLADSCYLGAPVIHRGLMTLGSIHIGERSFVANAAHVPITTPRVEDGCLIGVLSISPDTMPPQSDWLGSPPMRLPKRIRYTAPNERTWDPPKHLVFARGFFNYFKMNAPSALQEMLFWITVKLAVLAFLTLSTPLFVLAFLGISLAATLTLALLPIAAKWLLVGRYPTGERYLWSFWMWRVEIAYEIELAIHIAQFDALIQGTPIQSWLHRLNGADIGQAVCFLDGRIMEADLTSIGDYSCIEGFLQTHLFEDRVMKLDHIRIGKDCSLGHEACGLYSSQMGDASSLDALSLIMKGEAFLPHHRYRGLPAEDIHLAEEHPALP